MSRNVVSNCLHTLRISIFMSFIIFPKSILLHCIGVLPAERQYYHPIIYFLARLFIHLVVFQAHTVHCREKLMNDILHNINIV